MQTFEWIDATSVEQAATLLGESNNIAKAGGMDILDLMKEGILKPSRVVNLKTIYLLHYHYLIGRNGIVNKFYIRSTSCG